MVICLAVYTERADLVVKVGNSVKQTFTCLTAVAHPAANAHTHGLVSTCQCVDTLHAGTAMLTAVTATEGGVDVDGRVCVAQTGAWTQCVAAVADAAPCNTKSASGSDLLDGGATETNKLSSTL